MKTIKDLTIEDLDKWGVGSSDNNLKNWFLGVIKGDYTLTELREDILSVINNDIPIQKAFEAGRESMFIKVIETSKKMSASEAIVIQNMLDLLLKGVKEVKIEGK